MICVGGIHINVVYKKVRKVTLKITTNGEVVIVCSKNVGDEYLSSFASKHADWIRKNLEKKSNAPLVSKNLFDGDKVTILGKLYTLKVYKSDKNALNFSSDELQLFIKENDYEKRASIYKKLTLSLLRGYVEKSLVKWKEITGLDCGKVTFKDMKSRWGSCNIVSKSIAFSLRLISQSLEQIDYVVLHELAHTIYSKHDKDFYSYLSFYLPRHKQISKNLLMPIEK